MCIDSSAVHDGILAISGESPLRRTLQGFQAHYLGVQNPSFDNGQQISNVDAGRQRSRSHRRIWTRRRDLLTMTVRFDTNASDKVDHHDLSEQRPRSYCFWASCDPGATTQSPLVNVETQARYTHRISRVHGDHLGIGRTAAPEPNFGSGPAITTDFYGSTARAAGANSYNGYFRDNASGSLTTIAATGIAAFTALFWCLARSRRFGRAGG